MNCPACGRPAPENAARCAACGAGLIGPSDKTLQEPERPTMTRGGASESGTTAARFALGASLGSRYEIQALLGQGGMGAVYKAHDRELERTVAIKVIRPEMAQNPDVLERFKREIILASKVTHKNVLRIHDFGEAGDVKFISMNYVEGESLTQLLQREGPLSIERALPLVTQIGEALQAAHEAGVVHRDLKPQNILLDRLGHAFIADFGISRSMESGGTITEAGSLIGTVDYMSPEQARGEKSDPRGDLYSFGVILYVMLTGKLPFAGGDALSVMMKRLHVEPAPVRKVRPELPAWIEGVVTRAMQRDPADRYQTVAEMLHDLTTRHAATSWRRLRRRVLIPALIVLAAGAAIYGGFRYFGSRPLATAAGPVTSLAVLPFQNATGDSSYHWAKDGLPSLLRQSLLQAKELRLAGEDRVTETIGTLRAAAGEEARPANMRRIATIVGAEYVMAGKLLKLGGDRLRIEAVLQKAGSEDTTAPPLTVDGAGDAAIQSMLSELTPKILEAVGVSRGWRERARGAAKPMTQSAEALALHGQGLAFVRAGKYGDASKKLEEAVQKDPGFAVARALLAETYDNLGDADKAKAEAKKAAEGLAGASPYEAARIQATVALIDGDPAAAEKAYASLCEITPSDPEVFFQLASVRLQQANYPGALEAYGRVVALDPKYAKAHAALGQAQFRVGNFEEAVRELNTAVQLFDETGNEEGKGSVLNGLGITYMTRGQYLEAMTRFQQSLNIKRQFNDQIGVRKALINLAWNLARLGRFDESVATGQEAVAVARKIGDREGLARTLGELGEDYMLAGQTEKALETYQESLKIFREKGVHDPAGEATVLSYLANATTQLGRTVEGLYALEDVLAKRRAIGDPGDLVRTLSDIGDNERLQGNYDKALKYYTEGLSVARTNERPYVTVFLSTLSSIHEEQGDYAAALSLIEEAEKLARDSQDMEQLSTLLTDVAGVKQKLGDFAAAAVALNEADSVAPASKSPQLLAELAIGRASLALATGEREKASAAAREAVRVTRESKAPLRTLRARVVAGEEGRSVKELELVVKEAEGFGLIPVESSARLALARVRPTVEDADASVRTATSLGQRDVLFQAQTLAGKALMKQGDRSQAADRLAAALVPLEEMLRGFKDENVKLFLTRPDIVEFGKIADEAFRTASRSEDAERLKRVLRP